MLKLIIKIFKKIILKRVKRDMSAAKDFDDFKYTALLYTMKFQSCLILIWCIHETLKQKIDEYIFTGPGLDDIPPEISILLNKSYDEITWDQINKAKEFLKNKDNILKKDIKIQEIIKPDRLIRLEFYLKIYYLILLIPLSVTIIIILLRDSIKNKIKKTLNSLWFILLDDLLRPIFDKKNRRDVIILILFMIIAKIIRFIIEYSLYI